VRLRDANDSVRAISQAASTAGERRSESNSFAVAKGVRRAHGRRRSRDV